jgi:HPt (histidine-containing phosphotransfer) domain-containing protein
VDLKAALARFDGDAAFMLEMCRDFRDHLPGRITEINSAFNESDINRLHRQSHTLKGIALNFEATFLAELAAEVEELCRHENLHETQPLVREIEKEALRVQEFLTRNI